LTPPRLTLACWDYDRTRPLIDGRVKPAGVDLDIEVLRPRQMFPRMLEHRAFDASELSLASLIGLVGRDGSPFIGVPAMLSRFFRHSCIYVRAGANIHAPRDLIGKRVGATQFAATATVFMKGMLRDEYGVSQDDMEWLIGGLDAPTQAPLIPLDLPKNVRLSFLGPGETLEKALAEERLDALLSIYIPPSFLRRSPNIKRLFPNYREVEADYYRRTGIFPIMHTLAMRADVLAAHPWAAISLYDAFVEARGMALDGLYDTDALRIGLPWLLDHVEDLWSVFGADWWPYGVEPNLPTLEAACRYAYEQGLSPRLVAPRELFAAGIA